MKISVLTPSLNSARYLERAIRSVFDQNFPDVEHIVMDGGSTDGTLDILRRFPQVRWVSEPDRGQSDAMNKAFAMATGDIVVYLNADDFFEPGVFRCVSEFFHRNPAVDLFVGSLYHRYEGSPRVELTVPETTYRCVLLSFKYQFPHNPVCYFYRRRVQQIIGPFPLDEHYAMDYWFLLRAFRRFRVERTGLVFGTFFHSPTCKTSSSHSGRNCRRVALAFCRQHDPFGWCYYHLSWCWYLLFTQPGKWLRRRVGALLPPPSPAAR